MHWPLRVVFPFFRRTQSTCSRHVHGNICTDVDPKCSEWYRKRPPGSQESKVLAVCVGPHEAQCKKGAIQQPADNARMCIPTTRLEYAWTGYTRSTAVHGFDPSPVSHYRCDHDNLPKDRYIHHSSARRAVTWFINRLTVNCRIYSMMKISN